MTLYKLLTVILAICASSSALPTKVLPYAESFEELKRAGQVLADVILSMGDESPHLNDYRRQYSEIAHSIYHIAYYSVMAVRCEKTITVDLFDNLLEEAITEAITNATYVVEITKQLFDDLNEKTNEIQKLINISCANEINKRNCDEVIQNFILYDPKKYADEASILLIAGESAKLYNLSADKFIYVSKELDAHKYVIKNPVELKNIVDSLIPLVNALYPNETVC